MGTCSGGPGARSHGSRSGDLNGREDSQRPVPVMTRFSRVIARGLTRLLVRERSQFGWGNCATSAEVLHNCIAH